MNSIGAPSPRALYASAWTGTEFLVWGGGVLDPTGLIWSGLSDGARYNPSLDRWDALPSAALAGRYGLTGVWTGVEFVVWGGANGTGTVFGDGSRFDPVGGVWNALSNVMPPEPRRMQAAVWSGTEMLVAGGDLSSGLSMTAGAWTP